jgi:murein DD-endopeptidase MepM/ murein hydrolase activator NlpD
MEKKYYTFLVYSGANGKLRKIELPFYIVHLVLGFSVVGILAVAALASSYARMLLKVSNYNEVRAEREALKTQNRTLEGVVNQTNAKLTSLQSLAADVALTYGFGEARRPRFPEALLALATRSNSTVESSFRASLYVFNQMRRASVSPPGITTAQGMFSNPTLAGEAVPSIWPVRGQITAGFGQRMDPFSGEGTFHAGLDISAPYGSGVEAAGEGVVLKASREAGYGNEILIDHGGGITTKYGHLSKINVFVGEVVQRGQLIGAVGMTGKATGPHLHYEVIVQDTPVNPTTYLRG